MDVADRRAAEGPPAKDAPGWHAEEERRRPHLARPAARAVPTPDRDGDRVEPPFAIGAHAGDDRGRPHTTFSPIASAPLSPEFVKRFHALIDDVTDDLMQGPHADRATCRADAIALLVAASGLVADGPAEHGESPLMYLLLEEQQRAAAVLGRAQRPGPALTFMKA